MTQAQRSTGCGRSRSLLQTQDTTRSRRLEEASLKAPRPAPAGSAHSHLLKRLLRRTIRRKPVGSVTELSLLFISSNCWSMRSPASLSVSLLAQALRGKCRASPSQRGSPEHGSQPSGPVALPRPTGPWCRVSLRPGHLRPLLASLQLLPSFIHASQDALGVLLAVTPTGLGTPHRKELRWSQYCTPCVWCVPDT